MKNRIIGGAAIVLGLLITLGPQFLFKVCPPMEGGGFMKCHWPAQVEIGVGTLIAALCIAFVFFCQPAHTHGADFGIFLSSVLALLVPHALIGGCFMHTM
jgi:hypothetical protein